MKWLSNHLGPYLETLLQIGEAEGFECLGLTQPQPNYQHLLGLYLFSLAFLDLSQSFCFSMYVSPQVASAMTTFLPVGSSSIVTSFIIVVPCLQLGVISRKCCWCFGLENGHDPLSS